MLRQGKSAVQALHEVEVLTTDYVGDDALLMSASLGQHSASSPMTIRTIVRGRLHIRTGNIGEYRKNFWVWIESRESPQSYRVSSFVFRKMMSSY